MSDDANYRKRLLEQLKQKGYQGYDPTSVSDSDLSNARLGPSAFEQAKEDEGAIAAQQDASNRYKEMADNGGFTQADRTATLRSQQLANQQDAARRKSILSEMQQRGTAGSGAELAARLSSADSAASQNADNSQEIAARGEQRRDAAIAARGQLGGQMRDQSYRSQSNLANARDGVSRFNADLAGRQAFQNNQNTNQAGLANNQGRNNFDSQTFGYDYNGSVDDENRKIAEREARNNRANATSNAFISLGGNLAGKYMGKAHGGKVDGEEMCEGDDEENDIYPHMLSAGEIVIPKSKAKDPIEAAKFVAAENDEELGLEEALRTIAAAIQNLDRKGK